jgi:hypothetical protein
MQWMAVLVTAALALGLARFSDRARHTAVIVFVVLTVGVWFTQMKP